MFNELRLYQDDKFDVINSSISTLIEQNKEIQISVYFMSEQYDTLVHKLNSIEKEKQQYKSQIKSLESKIDVLEKGLGSTTVEIRNTQILEQENKQRLTTTIKNICSAVDSNPLLQDLEVRDVFGTKTNTIMVDFTTTTRKENFISKYREFNKLKRTKKEPQLNTQIINIPGPSKTIFISESLTKKYRRIHYLARQLFKDRKLVATWMFFGKVYAKKEEGNPPIQIKEESDIHLLFL
ncbi:unnamed protein product [Parnassius apollo]|uniref:(apollo) hypothetical protein n=1 Tax=Parnassius apollo TaxID=110799 RepID=A0A8S3XIX1_PARAO|nr:unnamed protein product [Parnassius apollo]